MTTVTIWLLISLGNSNKQFVVIERFADMVECQRVASVIRGDYRPTVQCVQARVVKP